MPAIANQPVFSDRVRLAHLPAQITIDDIADVPRPLAVDDLSLSVEHRGVIRLGSSG